MNRRGPLEPTQYREQSQTWRDRAACAGMTDFTEVDLNVQRTICRSGCPVITERLSFAMKLENERQTYGRHHVWGGMAPAERSKLAKAAGQ